MSKPNLQCLEKHLADLNRRSRELTRQLRLAQLRKENTDSLVAQLQKINQERNREKKRVRLVSGMQGRLWLKL